MSMQPSFSGSDVNPFSWIANKFGKMGANASEYQKAQAMHQAHYAAHQYGMQAAEHKAGLEEQAQQSQHGRNMEFFSSVLRHAKHETPIHLSIGDVSAQFTKRPKTMKAPTAAPTQETKASRPLPVRDPKTGRAMKAPE